MPEYDYLCKQCGPFSNVRPMAAYADPQPCPACGQIAPRALLTMPALGAMDTGRRTAMATNERSAYAPAVSSRSGQHPSGRANKTARGAAKSFPGRRPWMISH